MEGVASMKKSLNRSRVPISRLVLLSALLLALLTTSHFSDESLFHRVNDMLGFLLVGVCMLGRLYCTLFIGGRKNSELVTYGPYSIMRNPLYVFSFLGTAGIGLTSNQLTVFSLLTGSFVLVYFPLIRREEEFLREKFGEAFSAYACKVPRFIPNFSLYHGLENVTVDLRRVHSALRDAVWWPVPLIILEIIEWGQEAGVLTPLGKMW